MGYAAMSETPPAGGPVARDIVTIGGSAGSLDALRDVVGQLPPDPRVALFVVVHVLPTGTSRLPEILARGGWLPARHAREGDSIQPGRILVAPPDQHMLLHAGGVHLDHGPRENSTRPAIDPLFRTAATAFGPRVCGVVLSGNLDDGSEGLRLVAAADGLSIVQDPKEAPHPQMPLNALGRVPAAEVLSAVRIGTRLAGLAGTAVGTGRKASERAPGAPPLLDVQIGAADPGGIPTGLTCPECGGVLWAEPGSENVHCRVGHRYNLEALWDHKDLSVEQSVWAAVRALQEDATLAEHLAERARSNRNTRMAARFERRSRDAGRHAEILRRLLLEHDSLD
jgi:two-component system chemotaxis response regulator CheB